MDDEDRAPDADRRLARKEDGAAAGAGDVVVPWERLSAPALAGVITEFVTREGTEHGMVDVPLETKIAQVRRQLERGEVLVLFDGKSETVNLVLASEHARRQRG
jgi:uncharacterized protein YheU (UPF0270 family)